MLCIDGLCSTSPAPNGLNEWLWLIGYLAFDKTLCIRFCDIFMYMWLHFPMVMCIVSTTFIIFECWYIFLALLNLYLRDPSLERKASFFLKVVLLLPWDLPSTTLGTFWVLTNWRRCQGTKVHICPRRMTEFEERFLWENMNFISRRGCIFALATPLWNLFRT